MQQLNPIKLLTFKGKIEKNSARMNELFVNYSKDYSDLQKGCWQILVRDITFVSVVKEKPRSMKQTTFFTISSNFVRSVNESNESTKTNLITFEYQNYGSRLFHNPQTFWFYVTDSYQIASIKLDCVLGEKNFETFDVVVSVLFRRIE